MARFSYMKTIPCCAMHLGRTWAFKSLLFQNPFPQTWVYLVVLKNIDNFTGSGMNIQVYMSCMVFLKAMCRPKITQKTPVRCMVALLILKNRKNDMARISFRHKLKSRQLEYDRMIGHYKVILCSGMFWASCSSTCWIFMTNIFYFIIYKDDDDNDNDDNNLQSGPFYL